MFENSKYNEVVNKNFKSIEDIENVISLLRAEGASQIETVKALTTVLKITLKVADRLVLNSKTWEDKKDFNLSLREKFFKNPKKKK